MQQFEVKHGLPLCPGQDVSWLTAIAMRLNYIEILNEGW
jgi:hypothetical protein